MLVPARTFVAFVIVLMRIAFRLGNHFGFSPVVQEFRDEIETPPKRSLSRAKQPCDPFDLRLDNLVKPLGDALLDRVADLNHHFLSECQKLLILRGDPVELLARMRSRKLDHLRR